MQLYLYATDENISELDLQHDLVLRSGDDQIIDLFIMDNYEVGLPLSGATLYFVVKANPTDTDSTAVIKKYYESTLFPNPLSGEAAITLLAEDTDALVGNYCYQIMIDFPSLPKKIISEGLVCFRKNLITHLSNFEPGEAPYSGTTGSSPSPSPTPESDFIKSIESGTDKKIISLTLNPDADILNVNYKD